MKKERIPVRFLYRFLTGAIGKQFVIKHYKYGAVKTKYPDMTKIIASKSQRKCRDLFKEAVTYAKSVMADPQQKAVWQKRIRYKKRVFVRVVRYYMLEAKEAMIRKQQAVDKLIRSCFTKEKNNFHNKKQSTLLPIHHHHIIHKIQHPVTYRVWQKKEHCNFFEVPL